MSIIQFIWRQYVRLKNPSCTIDAEILAKDVQFEDHVTVESGCYIGTKKIGKYTFIGLNSYVDKSTDSIGRFCSIAMNSRISLNNHPLDWVSTHPFTYNKKYGFVSDNIKIENVNTKKTTIGNDAWIGTNVSILSGITIGNGAVIGAHSLVTKDVEPYSIVRGTPAQHIRFRFDEATIKKLLDTAWWNWDNKKLKKHITQFRDPGDFIKHL